MVKLMTVLLTMEGIDSGVISLDQKITVSKNAAGMGGSQVFLDAGSDYSVEDLLKSTIVASANDASVALGETLAGNEKDFVDTCNVNIGADECSWSGCCPSACYACFNKFIRSLSGAKRDCSLQRTF